MAEASVGNSGGGSSVDPVGGSSSERGAKLGDDEQPSIVSKKTGLPKLVSPTSPRAPRWFEVVYWPFFGLVFVFLLVLLFQPMFSSQDVWGRNLQYVGFGVVIVCFALWIGDVLNYLHLSAGVRRAIFTTFILAVLGAAASYIVKPPVVEVKRPVLRDAVLFDERFMVRQDSSYTLTRLQRRQNTNFDLPKADPKLDIVAGLVVGNITGDNEQRIDLEATLVFRSPVGLYDIAAVKRTKMGEWQDKPLVKQLTAPVVAAGFGGVADTESVLLFHLVIDPRLLMELKADGQSSPVRGSGELTVLVRDKKAGTWSEAVLPFTIKDGQPQGTSLLK